MRYKAMALYCKVKKKFFFYRDFYSVVSFNV